MTILVYIYVCPGDCGLLKKKPSKHAWSDPEAFWLRPVMAITANVQPESGRIVYARSNLQHTFQFHFSKEAINHIVQNGPRSDRDDLVRVWQNTSGPEASRCAGITWPGFWQDATGPLPVSGRTQPARYQFPTFRLGSVLPQTSRIILCKSSPDPI